MAQKSLNITIIAHQGYCRHNDKEALWHPQSTAVFTALSHSLLPLLRMFRRLEEDRIPFSLGMVFSPTLCALLADPLVKQQYADWLDKIVLLGQRELSSLPLKSPAFALAETQLALAEQNRREFTEDYRGDILSGFNRFIQSGHIEALATCATYAFLPHYADMEEACNAQIEAGLRSHKHFFSLAPEGFWLPYLGYTPGIEKILKAYGLSYTILETHGLLFAHPLPEKGIFAPARCGNSLAVFARDGAALEGRRSIEDFMRNPAYRNQNRDIVFEKDAEALAGFIGQGGARIPSGYKYWANGESDLPRFYNPGAAAKQVKQDAAEFWEEKKKRLEEAGQCFPDAPLSLVCTLNARTLGELWHEGIPWLEEVFRKGAEESAVSFTTAEKILQSQSNLQKVTPCVSASCGAGYGENLLDNTNSWLIRYARKACERMVSLANRFSGGRGPQARMLNLAAKEVLLAQASDWPKMLHAWRSPEYAEERFKESIGAFTTVYDSLGAKVISTEWLTNFEKKRPLFPWLNYLIFCKKQL
ncbi:MAG: DUF1957 domain-containing protein [Treponema sp.]|jgi:1,4-alpha-glucan branching enzyme|nr:DUF1957 domain-containing protein [Treponema sp.]